MAEVQVIAAAEADYKEGFSWYLAHSPQAASRFEAAFESALGQIAANPELYPRCDDRHRFCMLRRYPFSLIYRVDGDLIRVVAVAHSRRRPGYWHGRA